MIIYLAMTIIDNTYDEFPMHAKGVVCAWVVEYERITKPYWSSILIWKMNEW